MEELICVNQLSQILDIKESTIRSWVFQKKIPCIHVGRLVRFKLSDIEEWIGKDN